MKTQPFQHQEEGFRRLAARPRHYALGCEQGTGKTWMLLADAEAQFRDGRVSGLLVVAPKGVHSNWIRREAPAHLDVAWRGAYWLSGAGKRHMKKVERVMQPSREELRILAVNVDALNTKKGRECAERFLEEHRAMMVVDESQRIKSPSAGRAKAAVKLGRLARSRRIASGTLVPNSPVDLFMQYEFLAPGLLGTNSYRAFVAEFCELLPPESHLVKEIKARSRYKGAEPQVVRRDALGRPQYRNLDKLRGLIEPHTYRVLKKDCLDLPEKIYQTHYFELSPPQRKLYEFVKENLRLELPTGEVETFTALTALNKLRQVTSGFVMLPDETMRLDDAERLNALLGALEDIEGKVIIWASYREEIRMIVDALRKLGVVEYHGGVKAKDREAAVDEFQNGDVRFFVANPQAGGTGLTLTAATTAIYFSNSFSLEERLQSEDRCHRIGTKEPVVYIDLAAADTVDERIAAALQSKAATAEEILAFEFDRSATENDRSTAA